MKQRLADALVLLGVLCILAAFWLDAVPLCRRAQALPTPQLHGSRAAGWFEFAETNENL